MSNFHSLTWAKSGSEFIVPITSPQAAAALDWHAKATYVLEALQSTEVLKIPADMTLPEAERLFNQYRQRYAVVVNADGQALGIFPSSELHGRQSVTLSNLLQLPWNDLMVSYLMVPLEQIPVLTEQQLRTARIGDIAATMQSAGKDYLWIRNQHGIMGLISAFKILAMTGESVRLSPRAVTFIEIFKALRYADETDLD